MRERRRSIKQQIYFDGTSAGKFTVNYLTCLIYVIDENTLEIYMRITFMRYISENKIELL